jgi:hypothetical protein
MVRYKIIICMVLLIISASAFGEETVGEEDVATENAKAMKGNDKAFDRLFDLMKNADGAVAEEIDIDLGQTIIKYPKKFLEHLAKHNTKVNKDDCPAGLVGNTGDDDNDEDVSIYKKRIKALQSVTDESLTSLKKKCINSLREEIKESQHAEIREKLYK